jgi:hypothetical protein
MTELQVRSGGEVSETEGFHSCGVLIETPKNRAKYVSLNKPGTRSCHERLAELVFAPAVPFSSLTLLSYSKNAMTEETNCA